MSNDWFPAGTPASPAQRSTESNTGEWVDPPRAGTVSLDDRARRPLPGERVYIGGAALAPAWRRLLALAIDWTLSWFLPLEVFQRVGLYGTEVAVFVAFMITVGNSFVIGNHGQSIGKRLAGIQAVRPIQHRDGKSLVRPGVARTVLRVLLHLLDAMLLLGVLWAFVSPYRRTPADAWTHTVHVLPSGRGGDLPDAPATYTHIS